MAVIRSTDHPNLLNVPLNEVFHLHLKEVSPEYKKWIKIESTSRAYEESLKIDEFGAVPQKNEGALFQFENIDESSLKRITPLEYGLGYVITRKMRDDDLHGVMVNLTTALRRSFRHLFEVKSYEIWNNATSTTAKYLGLDGKSLLNTAHPLMGGGSQANKPTTDLDISETAVEAAILNFHARVGENGLPRLVTPKVALVTGAFQFKAAQIFRNAMKYGTANTNDENWVKKGPDSNGIDDYVASRYITDAGLWAILSDKSQHDLTLRVRVNPEFQVGSDFRTDNYLARGYARLESGFFNWQNVYGSTGTS
jgi:hypothetical protein